MDWYLWRARIEALESKIQRALASVVASAAALAGITRIQAGNAVLTNGSVTITTATITAQSVIVAQFATSSGGDGAAPPFTTRLETPARIAGSPGSFDISALTNVGVLDATNQSSVSWIVIN